MHSTVPTMLGYYNRHQFKKVTGWSEGQISGYTTRNNEDPTQGLPHIKQGRFNYYKQDDPIIKYVVKYKTLPPDRNGDEQASLLAPKRVARKQPLTEQMRRAAIANLVKDLKVTVEKLELFI